MKQDPICKMMVDEKNTNFISQINNKTIFLCSLNCKEKLEKNPQKYGY